MNLIFSFVFLSQFFFLLVHFLFQEIIVGGDVIVPVVLNLLFDVVALNAWTLSEVDQYLLVYLDIELQLWFWHGEVLLVKVSFPDLFDGHALGGVYIEDALEQLLGLARQVAGTVVLAVHDLVVEHLGVGVVERQVPAQQSEQDHAWRPDVRLQPVVFQTRDHLWRRVTRRTTSRF